MTKIFNVISIRDNDFIIENNCKILAFFNDKGK